MLGLSKIPVSSGRKKKEKGKEQSVLWLGPAKVCENLKKFHIYPRVPRITNVEDSGFAKKSLHHS